MRRKVFLDLLFLFVFTIAAGLIFTQLPRLVEAASSGVSDYAWSSNISWISFEGVSDPPVNAPYSVKLVTEVSVPGGSFVDYAWSSNIGWIKFNPAIGSGGNALPAGATNAHGVKLDPTDQTKVIGWARACSIFKSGCSGNSNAADNFGIRPLSETGGWDGWISMNCSNTSSCATSDYGVTYDSATGKLGKFAWGSDVVGWIKFCKAAGDPGGDYCVTVDTLNVICSVTPTAANLNDVVTWTATNPIDSPPGTYTYAWTLSSNITNPPTVTTEAGITNGAGINSVTHSYPVAQTIGAELTVTGGGKSGSATCNNVVVSPPDQKTLNVNIQGPPTALPYGHVIGDIVGGNGAIDCGAGTSNCEETYTVTAGTPKTVVLTANVPVAAPLPAVIVFNNWSGVSCAGGPAANPCTFTINAGDNSPINVDAYFRDDNLPPGTATLTATPFSVTISRQGNRIPARSSLTEIKVVNGTEPINVCVTGITSRRNGQSLNQIIDTATKAPGHESETNVPPQCSFDNSSAVCSSSLNCFSVSPDATVSKQFSIMLADKFYEVKANSPYEVRIDAKTEDNAIVDSLTWSQLPPQQLQFLYEVQDVRPR